MNRKHTSCPRDDDRGAIVVWFALMVVVLLGSGALIIDMGALYRERRELQNGADAAALAVAIDCAATKCTGTDAMALKYAQLNASDNAATIDLICGKGPGLTPCKTPPPEAANVPYYVKVTTSTNNPTSNPGSPSKVRFLLGPLLNKTAVGSTVHASAVVAWGPLGKSNILPIAVSYCSFAQSGGSVGADGTLSFPATVVKVGMRDPNPDALTNPAPCTGPGGQTTPGGFTWIGNSAGCSTTIDITGGAVDVPNDPGANAGQDCKALFPQLASVGDNQTFVLPLFDSAALGGSNSTYHVTGLVGFDMCSWNGIPGMTQLQSSTECRSACAGANNVTQICGYFHEAVVTEGEWGGSRDFGTRLIKVIG